MSWIQFSHSVVSHSLRPHEPQHARPPCPSPIPSLPKLMSIESLMPSNHLILSLPLLLLPPVPPSIRVFSNESVLRIRWPKYWSFSFSISPSNEHPELISIGWTGWISLKSKGLLRVFSNTIVQKHLQHLAFFIVQLSHPYMTIGRGKPYRTTRNTKSCQTTHSFSNSLKKSSFSLLELCWHWQNKDLSLILREDGSSEDMINKQ